MVIMPVVLHEYMVHVLIFSDNNPYFATNKVWHLNFNSGLGQDSYRKSKTKFQTLYSFQGFIFIDSYSPNTVFLISPVVLQALCSVLSKNFFSFAVFLNEFD